MSDSDSDDNSSVSMTYDEEEETPHETALTFKEEGNSYYKRKEYKKAIAEYTKAITLDPSEASFYTNRAAAKMMILEYTEALDDCNNAINIFNLKIESDDSNEEDVQSNKNSCAKALHRKATALKFLGKLQESVTTLKECLNMDPTHKTALSDISKIEKFPETIEETRAAMRQGYFRRALNLVDKMISELGNHVKTLNILKMEVLIKLQKPEDALNLSNAMMRSINNGGGDHTDLLQARATCLYAMGDLENAVKHLQQAMRSDPDNKTCRDMYKKYREMESVKAEGAAAYKVKDFEKAIERWSHCLSLDPTNKSINSKLHCNRANALSSLKEPRLQEALRDCDKAIYLDNNYMKAYLRRADCYLSIGEPDNIKKAIEDYEKVAALHDGDAPSYIKDKIKKAKVALKRSNRKDFYRILGLGPNAEEAEIKKAYKKMALKYHPDRHSTKGDEEKAAAEAKFKDIGEAYEVLTDPEKKKRYDSGVDPEDLENPHAGHGGHSHGGAGGIDPNVLFQMFMQQQGGMGGGGGRRGGNPFGF